MLYGVDEGQWTRALVDKLGKYNMASVELVELWSGSRLQGSRLSQVPKV